MNELVGKYLNGYRIVKVEKDPFIENQINLWTDETKADFLGNREVVKFYVRDYPSCASIYQEQVDKENYQLKSIIKEIREYIETEYLSEFDDFEKPFILTDKNDWNKVLEILDKENKE